MVKLSWTLPKKLFSGFCGICSIGWALAALYAIYHFNDPIYVFYCLLMGTVFVYLLQRMMVPRSMKIVKEYIKRDELEQLIDKESFFSIDFSRIQGKIPDIYYSRKWLYVNSFYVPRAFIYTVTGVKHKEKTKIFLVMKNGMNIKIADIPDHSVSLFLKQIKKHVDEIKTDADGLYNKYDPDHEKKTVYEFNKAMTRQKFLKMIV